MSKNYDLCAVDVSKMSIYDFANDGETKEHLLERANKNREESIESWTSNCKKYPCEKYNEYLEQAKKSNYQVMTYDEFQLKEKHFLLDDDKLQEVTEDEYDDALNCLPPMKWCTISGVEMFCMSECYTVTYTNQYAKYKGKYYCKMVDHTDKTTWIHNLIA